MVNGFTPQFLESEAEREGERQTVLTGEIRGVDTGFSGLGDHTGGDGVDGVDPGAGDLKSAANCRQQIRRFAKVPVKKLPQGITWECRWT